MAEGPQTTSLVCEGACNPDFVPLDAEVQAARRRESSYYLRRVYALDAALTARLRQLLHTPHESVTATRWRCTCCGHVRDYGLIKETRPRRALGSIQPGQA